MLSSVSRSQLCAFAKTVSLYHGTVRGFASATVTSYYDILGITPKASQKQIKAAYYRLSKVHHPDISTDTAASDNFSKLNEAYEVLSNTRTRREYDQGILNPLDIRSGHQASRVDVEYSEFARRGQTFGPRKKPPTGRTNIYNFDEYYRMHYDDVRVKQKRADLKLNFEEEHQQEKAVQQKIMVGVRLIGVVCVALGLNVIYHIIHGHGT